MGFCNWYFVASQISGYNLNTSCLKEIRRMYASRWGSKTSRLRGIEKYLSFEDPSAEQEEEKAAEPTLVEEPRVIDTPTTRAAVKRKLSADETELQKKKNTPAVDSPKVPVLESRGLALSSEASSYHPSKDEEGELMATNAEYSSSRLS
ncbi:uncharacterized protein A4U43_C08F18600 [Asparagus officinalis]|nr:uncharacterized protein A4U43_C08F18600 [Asparagus officinalis]